MTVIESRLRSGQRNQFVASNFKLGPPRCPVHAAEGQRPFTRRGCRADRHDPQGLNRFEADGNFAEYRIKRNWPELDDALDPVAVLQVEDSILMIFSHLDGNESP